MAHNISGCLHQTVPQRILQAFTRKSGKILQKQWVSASLLSSSQSDCFKHISASRTQHTARNPCRDQLTASRHQQLQQSPVCCAHQQQSGSYDSSFHASSQEPLEQLQTPAQASLEQTWFRVLCTQNHEHHDHGCAALACRFITDCIFAGHQAGTSALGHEGVCLREYFWPWLLRETVAV